MILWKNLREISSLRPASEFKSAAITLFLVIIVGALKAQDRENAGLETNGPNDIILF